MGHPKMDVLPHLKNSIPEDVFGYQISPFTLALEGWRRGLNLRFLSNKRGSPYPSKAIRFALSDGEVEYTFAVARGSIVTSSAIATCMDKGLTYKALKKYDVPTPEGRVFHENNSVEEIITYGEKLGYPLVVKATDLGGGRGVYANLRNIEELTDAVNAVRNELDKGDIIVERFFTGIDYRFYVVGNKVSGAIKFYPSNVIGDGSHTISQLIDIRNRMLKENKVYKTRLIKKDQDTIDYLKENGWSMDSVPKDNERVILRRQGTYVYYRIPVDVTDQINDELKINAINAIKSIDGLHHGSVDMIVNEETGEGVVNEVNSRGEISMHIYPIEGKARDIPKDIIDYYFPNAPERNEQFYFEYKPIKDMFLSGYASEITIPKVPDRVMFSSRVVISGEHLNESFMNWLKRKVAQLELAGKMEKTQSNNIIVELIGPKFKMQKLENLVKETKFKVSKVTKYTSSAPKRLNKTSHISFDEV